MLTKPVLLHLSPYPLPFPRDSRAQQKINPEMETWPGLSSQEEWQGRRGEGKAEGTTFPQNLEA